VATAETARRFPVRLIESGPAAGALAAAYTGRLMGRPSLLSFDMGGTTAKACLIENGEPLITGVVAIGDAWACTNPGRGFSVRVDKVELTYGKRVETKP